VDPLNVWLYGLKCYLLSSFPIFSGYISTWYCSLCKFCSKIGKLTLARLLTALDFLSPQHDKRKNHTEEVLKLYTELMKLDPTHSLYYKDEHSLVLLQQVKFTLFKYEHLLVCLLFLMNFLRKKNPNDFCILTWIWDKTWKQIFFRTNSMLEFSDWM
jgi:hypothetical protein